MRGPAPDAPTVVDGVSLTPDQTARLGRLIVCVWHCDHRLTAAQVVDYATEAFRRTVARTGDAFLDVRSIPLANGRRLRLRVDDAA